MDAINAIIVRRWSAHKMSLSTATRKAVVISLKATRRPCQQTRQEHCESVMSITTILIPRQQLLSQERQLWRCKLDKIKRRHSTRETSGRLGKFMPQISRDEHGINNKTYKKELTSKTKKEQSRCDTYATRHAWRLLDKPQIEPLGRASDTVPRDNRTSTSNNNKNYNFVST